MPLANYLIPAKVNRPARFVHDTILRLLRQVVKDATLAIDLFLDLLFPCDDHFPDSVERVPRHLDEVGLVGAND